MEQPQCGLYAAILRGLPGGPNYEHTVCTIEVELLRLDATGIHVAEYLTELPERQLLHERLQRTIDAAQKKYVATTNSGHSLEPKK